MVEERARDRDSVFRDRRQWQTREAQERERLPALRPPVLLCEVSFAAHVDSLGPGLAVRTRRPAGVGRERANHRGEVAADHRGVEVRGRDFRMTSQQTQRRVLGAYVIGSAAHVMIGARIVEEERDQFVQRLVAGHRSRRAIRQRRFQRPPAIQPELARERELHRA